MPEPTFVARGGHDEEGSVNNERGFESFSVPLWIGTEFSDPIFLLPDHLKRDT
jgi:hypothetical protein